jgi:hypothetical protein
MSKTNSYEAEIGVAKNPVVALQSYQVSQIKYITVNLTIKINFNILRSLSSSDIFTIYLHAFLQYLHPFEKTALKVSRGISARITRMRTRSSDGVSARYPISFPLT